MPSVIAALSLWKAGKTRDALNEALAVESQTPDSVEALSLLAELHEALDERKAAADCYRRAALLMPADAAIHRRLANAEFNAGLTVASIDSYRRAIALEPRNVRAHNNLGRVLEQIGDFSGAAACYREALAIDETYAIAHNNLGNVLQNKPIDALMCYQRAAALRPDFAEAWHNCAKTLLGLLRYEEVLAYSEKALNLKPMLAEAWYVRGGGLAGLDRSEEALICCDKALALKAEFPEALYARAILLRRRGDHVAAVNGFREALRWRPGYDQARISAVIAEIPALPQTPGVSAASREAFGSALRDLETDLERNPCMDATALVGASQPFYLAYQEQDNRELMRSHGRLCSMQMGRWQQKAGLMAAETPAPLRSKPRIAFVSAQIADHSVYKAITRGWLRYLDRRRFTLEVFDLGKKSDSQTVAARDAVDHYEQGHITTREWAAAVLERRPDVLIYPEVGMDQTTLQLASMRLAPTQVVSWGHPLTSGLPTIDYFLSADAFEPADADDHYTERLVRLPNFGAYLDPPAAASGPMQAREDPDGTCPILVCAGTPFKYAPEHDRVLIDIARRLGRCQFHFFSHQDGSLTRRLFVRLQQAFADAGLDGSEYLVLRPWVPAAAFHEFLRSADLLLDTIGFSGFNTVLQALECSLPVVTYRGRFMRGRLGSGIMERLALGQFVADSPRSYVDIAVSLAQNRSAWIRARNQINSQLPQAYRDQSTIDGLTEFLLSVI